MGAAAFLRGDRYAGAMALATSAVTVTSATVAVAATAVAPTTAIPDNCHTVVLQNRGTGDALVGRAAPGAAALTENTNAFRLVANAAITLEIGVIAHRGSMVEADLAGSGLVYAGVAATPTIQIIYLSILA